MADGKACVTIGSQASQPDGRLNLDIKETIETMKRKLIIPATKTGNLQPVDTALILKATQSFHALGDPKLLDDIPASQFDTGFQPDFIWLTCVHCNSCFHYFSFNICFIHLVSGLITHACF